MTNERFNELASRLRHAADGPQLDAVARSIWIEHGNGYLTDSQAEELNGEVVKFRTSPAPFVTALGSVALTVVGTAKRARRVKPADARERMRSAAFGGWLPRTLAAMFTIGELAVLSVIAREVAERGFCDLHVGSIAYRAGVSERTVRNARHVAVERGLLSCYQRGNSKNGLANLIRITSKEWLAWLAKRLPAKGGKINPPCHTAVKERGRTGVSSGSAGASPLLIGACYATVGGGR